MTSILLVDDEQRIVDLLSDFLGQYGYTIYKANDGINAEKVFRAHHPDLLISDVMMPERNGTDLAKDLLEDYPEMKLILLSGSGTTETFDLKTVSRFGGFEHLTKPFDMAELLNCVKTLIGEPA